MNGVLKLPLYYLLLFLVVFLLLAAFSLLLTWGSIYNPDMAARGYLVPATIILSANGVFSLSVLLAVALLLFRLVRLQGNRILSLMAIGLTAFAVYLGGLFILDGLTGALSDEARDLSYAVPDEQFLSFPESEVYVGEADGITLAPVVFHRRTEVPGFSRYATAVRDEERNELIVPAAGVSYPIKAAKQAFVTLFEAPTFLRRAFDDVGVLTERLSETYAPGSVMFVLTPVSLVMVMVGSWLFVRLTRWPLFNALCVLAFLRGVFFLYALFEGRFFRELAGAVIESRALGFVAPGFFIALALVLYSVALLMPSFEDWKREISNE